MRLAVAAGWAVVALSVGCERPRTELMVRVESEVPWGVGRPLQSVVLTVRRGSSTGALRSTRTTALGTGVARLALPLYVGLLPGDDVETPVWVEALGCGDPNGCTAGTAVVAQRAVVGFARGQTQELPMLLAQACVGAACTSDERCIASGQCAAAATAQGTVRPFSGNATPTGGDSAAAMETGTDVVDVAVHVVVDAGSDVVEGMDGSVMADVSNDTGLDTIGAMDAVVDGDGAVDVPVMVEVGSDAAMSMDVVTRDVPGDLGAGGDRPDDASSDVQGDGPAGDGVPAASDAETGRCPTGMVLIPAGSFMMGDAAGYQAQPAHMVTLSAFCMDLTEVTVAAWRGCSAPGCTAPDTSTNCNWSASPGAREDHPINCVDWNQARAYCGFLGGDLPTEAQWEYAARGMDSASHLYPWGNAAPGSQLCWSGGSVDRSSTCPVRSFPTGLSPFGVFDMAGNVCEWTLDWHASYSSAAAVDPTGPVSGDARVTRGGSWLDGFAYQVKAASRQGGFPMLRFVSGGFRCSRRAPR